MVNSRITGPVVVFAVLATASVAHAQFTDLINRVPDRANTLIAINLQKSLMSPLAQEGKLVCGSPASLGIGNGCASA